MSLGESEVDCIGVGHGSCSVMHALWSARTASVSVRVCVCVRLSGVATNLGRGKYGESGNGAWLGARERARGRRKGRERQGTAGEREGRDVAGGGAHVLYDVTCHVEVSQQPARPPVRHSADYWQPVYVHIM